MTNLMEEAGGYVLLKRVMGVENFKAELLFMFQGNATDTKKGEKVRNRLCSGEWYSN